MEPLEPFFCNINVLLLGLWRPFLEAVQDVNNVFNLFQIKHTVPRPFVLVPQFVNPWANRAHGFAVQRHLAALYSLQSITKVALNISRKSTQNFPRIAKPYYICKIC